MTNAERHTHLTQAASIGDLDWRHMVTGVCDNDAERSAAGHVTYARAWTMSSTLRGRPMRTRTPRRRPIGITHGNRRNAAGS